MMRRLRRMAGVLWGVCFFVVVVGQALVLADGPVRLEVDKGAGRAGPALNSPVIAPMPGAAPAAPRQVEQPKPTGAQPDGGSWWRTGLGWGRAGASWVLDAFTGADLDQWMKPEKFWYNLGSGVLSLATGAGTDEWKNIRNWDALQWGLVILNIVITVGTLGGGSLLVKLLGPVGKIAAKLLKPVGKLFGPLARPLGRVAGPVFERTFIRAADTQLMRTMMQFSKKSAEWVLSKGLRNMVKALDPNPLKNSLVKAAFKKLAESALGKRLAESWMGGGVKVAVESWHALRGTIGRLVGDNAVARAIREIPVGNTRVGVLLQRSGIGLKDVAEAFAKKDLVGLITTGLEKVVGTRKGLTIVDKAVINRVRVGLALKGELEAISKGRKRLTAILAWLPLAWNGGKRKFTDAVQAVANGIAAVRQAWDAGLGAARRAVEHAKAGIRRGAQTAANAAHTATIAVGSALAAAVDATQQRANDLGRTLRDRTNELWNDAVTAGARTVESAVEGVDQRRSTMTARVDNAVTALRDAPVAAARSVSDKMSRSHGRAESLVGSARHNAELIVGTASGIGRRLIQRISDAGASDRLMEAAVVAMAQGSAGGTFGGGATGPGLLVPAQSSAGTTGPTMLGAASRTSQANSRRGLGGIRRFLTRGREHSRR